MFIFYVSMYRMLFKKFKHSNPKTHYFLSEESVLKKLD